MTKINAFKIMTKEQVELALPIIKEVYCREKGWIDSVENQIPVDIAGNDKISWFMVTYKEEPAGLIRLAYDPPLELPEEYEVTLEKGVDMKTIGAEGRFVDIGRFMILPQFRKKMLVAIRLMSAAIEEVVQRDYTHFITDVFEDEATSPLNFHRKILGFDVIGRHIHGDLNCSCTRIILTMDIMKTYRRLKENGSRFYQSLSESLREKMENKLACLIGR